MEKQDIHIEVLIHAPIKKVWYDYNTPDAIMQWNQASPDWHCPSSFNDLRVGGRFKNRMEAKDGSFGFDFEGEYVDVVPFQKIVYRMDDGRHAHITLQDKDNKTLMAIDFEPEATNPPELQRQGWLSILNNFKAYTEK